MSFIRVFEVAGDKDRCEKCDHPWASFIGEVIPKIWNEKPDGLRTFAVCSSSTDPIPKGM
jgi:hypothetical protein